MLVEALWPEGPIGTERAGDEVVTLTEIWLDTSCHHHSSCGFGCDCSAHDRCCQVIDKYGYERAMANLPAAEPQLHLGTCCFTATAFSVTTMRENPWTHRCSQCRSIARTVLGFSTEEEKLQSIELMPEM